MNIKKYIGILVILVMSTGVISCKQTEETVPVKKLPEDPFRIAFHEAIQEKMRGNMDLAAELFEKCLSYNDQSDAVHYALSDVYEQLGKSDLSVEHALKAFELDKENRWYQIRLANIYFDKGNYHRSAHYFELAIAEEKNIEVKFRYAETLIYSQQYKKAIAILDELEVETGLAPNISLTKHDMYLELGDPIAAQRELDKLIEDDPNNIENRMVVADYFLRTNQPEAAEQVANDALKIAPNNGEVRLILADIAIRKGDLDGCFDHLFIGFNEPDVSLSRKIGLIGNLQRYAFEESEDGKKIELGLEKLYQIIYTEDSQNDTLHVQYAYFLQMQNKPVDAIKQFEVALDINPNSFENWLQLLYTEYHIEDYDGMYKQAKKAIELFPAQPLVFLLGGIAAYEIGDYESSEEWLFYGKDLVVNDPATTSDFEHQQGNLSWKQKDYEKAHMFYEAAKKTDPFNGNIYHSQALCYIDEGKKDLAIKEVESAIEQAPTNAYFYDLKGLVYFKLGDFETSRKAYESALLYEGDNPKILEHYGDTLYKLGEVEDAIKKWQSARENGGYNAVLIKKIADKQYYEQ